MIQCPCGPVVRRYIGTFHKKELQRCKDPEFKSRQGLIFLSVHDNNIYNNFISKVITFREIISHISFYIHKVFKLFFFIFLNDTKRIIYYNSSVNR